MNTPPRTPASGRRRARSPGNNNNQPPPLRRRTAHGHVAGVPRGINQYGTFLQPVPIRWGNLNMPRVNAWQKNGAPRTLKVLVLATKGRQNEISLHNFANGNNAYIMYRGKTPVYYSPSTLFRLIKTAPVGVHLTNASHLNNFLVRVKGNVTLFRNTVSRRNKTLRNVQKVKFSNNKNKAAAVIQRAYRSRRRR